MSRRDGDAASVSPDAATRKRQVAENNDAKTEALTPERRAQLMAAAEQQFQAARAKKNKAPKNQSARNQTPAKPDDDAPILVNSSRQAVAMLPESGPAPSSNASPPSWTPPEDNRTQGSAPHRQPSGQSSKVKPLSARRAPSGPVNLKDTHPEPFEAPDPVDIVPRRTTANPTTVRATATGKAAQLPAEPEPPPPQQDPASYGLPEDFETDRTLAYTPEYKPPENRRALAKSLNKGGGAAGGGALPLGPVPTDEQPDPGRTDPPPPPDVASMTDPAGAAQGAPKGPPASPPSAATASFAVDENDEDRPLQPSWLQSSRPVDLGRPASGAPSAFGDAGENALADDGPQVASPLPPPPALPAAAMAAAPSPSIPSDASGPQAPSVSSKVTMPPRRSAKSGLAVMLLLGAAVMAGIVGAALFLVVGPGSDWLGSGDEGSGDEGSGDDGKPPDDDSATGTAAGNGSGKWAGQNGATANGTPAGGQGNGAAANPAGGEGAAGQQPATGGATPPGPPPDLADRADLTAVRFQLVDDVSASGYDNMRTALRQEVARTLMTSGPFRPTSDEIDDGFTLNLWLKKLRVDDLDDGIAASAECSYAMQPVGRAGDGTKDQARGRIAAPDPVLSDDLDDDEREAMLEDHEIDVAGRAVLACAKTLAKKFAESSGVSGSPADPTAPATVIPEPDAEGDEADEEDDTIDDEEDAVDKPRKKRKRKKRKRKRRKKRRSKKRGAR